MSYYNINFNPIIISIGYLSIYWYGFFYLISFLISRFLILKRIKKIRNINKKKINYIIIFTFIWVIIGSHIGYILIYNKNLIINPFNIFNFKNGGMSFHGGLITFIIVLYYFKYKFKYNFFQISDIFCQVIPISLGLGRIGNFINGELWGRVSINTPWSMLFKNSFLKDHKIENKHYIYYINKYGVLPRHPSQIYEFLLEGILLFLILNIFNFKKKSFGILSGLFLFNYGFIRFFIEFYREPDTKIYLFNFILTIGQLLSIPMIIIGFLIIYLSYFYDYFK